MSTGHLKAAAVVVVAALVGSACNGSTGGRLQSLPAPPATLPVEMADYEFRHAPTLPQAGRVVLVANNSGQQFHNFSVIPLPEDLPPIREQILGGNRQVVRPLAAIPPVRPGKRGAIALDLPPGRYGLVCFLVDQDGKSHASKGMASEFRVS